jgi:hypothetical protein
MCCATTAGTAGMATHIRGRSFPPCVAPSPLPGRTTSTLIPRAVTLPPRPFPPPRCGSYHHTRLGSGSSHDQLAQRCAIGERQQSGSSRAGDRHRPPDSDHPGAWRVDRNCRDLQDELSWRARPDDRARDRFNKRQVLPRLARSWRPPFLHGSAPRRHAQPSSQGRRSSSHPRGRRWCSP